MSKIEVFQGESQNFRITVQTGGNEVSNIEIGIVQNHARKVLSYSLDKETIVLEADNVYTFEMTALQTKNLPADNYAIEGKLVTSGGTTIKPLAELIIKQSNV